MTRFVLLCMILLAGCPSDGEILTIDPLPAPASPDLGIPLRISAFGGGGVGIELAEATFDDDTTTRCFAIARTTIATVHPVEVEALVIGHLYVSCDDTTELAATQLVVRRPAPSEPTGECSDTDGGVP